MKKILLIFLVIIMAGCSNKYTKAPEETPAPEERTTQEDIMSVRSDKKSDAKVIEEAVEKADEEVVKDLMAGREVDKAVEGVMSAEKEAKDIFRDIRFDYDKYDIRPDVRQDLDNIAYFLYRNKNFNAVIEGHCDERGTNEYNLALGEKRAKSIQDYLSSLGVLPSRTMVLTYGEEKPLCTEQDEVCWQKNRRAHFILVR